MKSHTKKQAGKKTKPKPIDVKHLRWAIDSRYANQRCCVDLLDFIQKHPAKCVKADFSLTAQNLMGVCFSLWRAAFLADKTGNKGESLKSATSFLGQIIQNNTIGFTQDRNDREWTFNYYINNARHLLQTLPMNHRDLVPGWTVKKRTPTERWDYIQGMLSQTVARFGEALQSSEH